MHNHWSQNLNLKNLIIEKLPRVIVECGAGEGKLTRRLSEMLDVYPCEIHVISDNIIYGLDNRIKWKTGLSYEVLSEYADNSIDLCIIDTDHNYWTLMKELAALFKKVKEGGIVALHDVETFYHDTGMAMSYFNGHDYPDEEIRKWSAHGGLGDALIYFLNSYPFQWKLMGYNKESNGAALIEKRTQNIFNIYTPGPGAIFAKPKKEKEEVNDYTSV